MTLAASDQTAPSRAPRLSPASAAALLTLAMLAVAAASGFPRLWGTQSDNDSLLRLVQIRDLMAGQGWFDLIQTRLGPKGLEMHWSRLVDLPVALLIGLFATVGFGQTSAEAIALTAWPLLLFCLSLWLILRTAIALGGRAAMLPAAVIGAVALYYTSIFAPGAIDHHNVQVTLAIAVLALLVERPGMRAGPDRDEFINAIDSKETERDASGKPLHTFPHPALGAGAASAIMLAVGMEAAPLVAGAGTAVALRFLILGGQEARLAAGFGLGFAGAAAATFGATVAPRDWLLPACDAYSFAQAGTATIAGLGLAAIASAPFLARTFGLRLAALGLLGIVLAGFALVLFPACLGDPYAGLDPRLKLYWLGFVSEAQPVWSMILDNPARAAACYATPLLALLLLTGQARRKGPSRPVITQLAIIGFAFAVSLWQVRGSFFSLPLAAIPLAVWVAEARRASEGGAGASLRLVLRWLASVNIVWAGAVAVAAAVFVGEGEASGTAGAAAASTCVARADHAALAALPAATVLAVSNLGSPILAYTHHRALAGPYHRNEAGNLAVLDAFMGSPEEARRVVAATGASIVAVCPGNAETQVLAEWAPQGLLADLAAGRVPAWLAPLPSGDAAGLRLYGTIDPNTKN